MKAEVKKKKKASKSKKARRKCRVALDGVVEDGDKESDEVDRELMEDGVKEERV